MRKLAVGTSFLLTVLVVRAAMAGGSMGHHFPGALAVLLLLTLFGFVVMLPALLVSVALRRFFNHGDAPRDELDEPSVALPGDLEGRGPAIAAKR